MHTFFFAKKQIFAFCCKNSFWPKRCHVLHCWWCTAPDKSSAILYTIMSNTNTPPPHHSSLWAVTFWHLLQRWSSAFLPPTRFCTMISPVTLSSLLGWFPGTTLSAPLSLAFLQEAKKRLQWKLHLYLSPSQPPRSVLKWGQMTHEPSSWTSALFALFSVCTGASKLQLAPWNGIKRNSAVGCKKKNNKFKPRALMYASELFLPFKYKWGWKDVCQKSAVVLLTDSFTFPLRLLWYN